MHTLTAQPTTDTPAPKTGTNPRRELARYTTRTGDQRTIYGQRVDGRVRLTDVGPGRNHLIEAGLDTAASLNALLIDYLQQAEHLGDCPMTTSLLANTLTQLAS